MTYPPLYIRRHGQTLWNAAHRIQGSLDSPLTEKGRAQACMQRDLLAECDLSGFEAVSSPQGRAFHTASLALEGLFDAIRTDRRLAEIGVGQWEGLVRGDLAIAAPMDESEESALDLYERAPGGEGFAALHRRCVEFLNGLQGPAVLVTHGVTSRMLRLVLTDRDISEIGLIQGGQGVGYYLENGVQRTVARGAGSRWRGWLHRT